MSISQLGWSFTGVGKWVLFVYLGCVNSLAESSSMAPLDELWQTAITHQQAEEFDQSLSLFSEWASVAKSYGIRSSSAYYNQAYAHWKKGERGKAQALLLKSSLYRTAPWRIWSEVQIASAIEHDSGVRNGLTNSFTFRFHYLLNPNLQLILVTTGFWLLVVVLTAVLLKLQLKNPLLLRGVLSCGGFLVALGAWGWVNSTFMGNFGVLDSEQKSIKVFQEASEDSEELLSLPSGTVVKIGSYGEEFVEISYPVAAWVPRDNLVFVQDPT